MTVPDRVIFDAEPLIAHAGNELTSLRSTSTRSPSRTPTATPAASPSPRFGIPSPESTTVIPPMSISAGWPISASKLWMSTTPGWRPRSTSSRTTRRSGIHLSWRPQRTLRGRSWLGVTTTTAGSPMSRLTDSAMNPLSIDILPPLKEWDSSSFIDAELHG